MPFVSVSQEVYMAEYLPDMHRKWVSLYGHHPKYKAYVRKTKRKLRSLKRKRKRKTNKRRRIKR